MEWYLWAMIAGAITALLGLGLFKWVPKSNKKIFLSLGLVAVVIGAVFWYGGGAMPFAVTTEDATTEVVTDVSSGSQQGITTFKAQVREKYSNSYTTVYGDLKVFDENADLSDPNVNPIDKVAISAGAGSDTDGLLTTDRNYRVVFENGSTNWYNYDFGIISFSSNDFNQDTGLFTFQPFDGDSSGILSVANISDPLDESSITGLINGQTNVTLGASVEVQGDANPSDNEMLVYDESEGDGDYYLTITLGASGANEAIKEMVLCFLWEDGASPEGNEISSIYAEHSSGSDLLGESELVQYWVNQGCVNLGEVKGGQSETVKITTTVTEANLDTSDDYKIVIDDLGSVSGQDILFSTGDTREAIDLDAKA